MLRNIFLKTVRDSRLSVLIWGGLMLMLLVSTGKAYQDVFPKGELGAKAIEEYLKVANSLSILVGNAYDIDTVGGFMHNRLLSWGPVLLSIMALLLGSMLIRGEEERGSLDLLASTAHSRRTIYLQKWAGMAVALLAINVLGFLGAVAGAASANLELSTAGAALTFLNIWLFMLFFGTLALALGQVASRKSAAGWTGGVLVASYLINNMSLSVPSLDWIKQAVS
jgi:ABC-2 type transport system permease protein